MTFVSASVLTVLLCAAAYIGGSVLFAIPVSRACKLPDPRAQGSANPGAISNQSFAQRDTSTPHSASVQPTGVTGASSPPQ
jgi:hypothetical protein